MRNKPGMGTRRRSPPATAAKASPRARAPRLGTSRQAVAQHDHAERAADGDRFCAGGDRLIESSLPDALVRRVVDPHTASAGSRLPPPKA